MSEHVELKDEYRKRLEHLVSKEIMAMIKDFENLYMNSYLQCVNAGLPSGYTVTCNISFELKIAKESG